MLPNKTQTQYNNNNGQFVGTAKYSNINTGSAYAVSFSGGWNVKTDIGNYPATNNGLKRAIAKKYFEIL